MIAYAWDEASGCLVRLSLCGLTMRADDVDEFCVRYADAIVEASAAQWCPIDPSGRERDAPAADCCEILLGDGDTGAWLMAIERGYETPWVPSEVVVVFEEGERESLRSFVAYQSVRAFSEIPCGGGHYRDWKIEWNDGESDLVIHIKRESDWRPRSFSGGRAPSAGIPLLTAGPFLGCTPEMALERWGESAHWFPSQGAHARSVGIWPDATLWFNGSGRCCYIQIREGEKVQVDSVSVFSSSYARTVARLRNSLPDLIAGRAAVTSVSAGICLTAPARWQDLRPAASVSLMPPSAMELRAQMLRPIARAVLPGGWRARVELMGQWLRDFPYSLTHPPRTRLQVIEEELDSGRWSDAVASFVVGANILGAVFPEEDKMLVEELCEELGVEERLGSGREPICP